MRSYYLFLVLILSSCQAYYLKKKKSPKECSSKKIEQSIIKVSEHLYASKFELDNFSYHEFLNDLEQRNDSLLLKVAKIENRNWDQFVYYGMPYLVDTYGQHPAYSEYPVVNVSQEGARMYCHWLTKKYNEFPKRKFQKVIFRLPNEEEWKLAARSGGENGNFPWIAGILDEKGRFKANFKRIPQTLIKVDTSSIAITEKPYPKIFYNLNRPDHIKSYPPNEFGLYNMSGNVAEMLDEKGRTKGGSWNSSGYYIGINAADEYEGFSEPSPMIGFRYFMEVIEK